MPEIFKGSEIYAILSFKGSKIFERIIIRGLKFFPLGIIVCKMICRSISAIAFNPCKSSESMVQGSKLARMNSASFFYTE